MSADDPFDLARFVDAQDGVYGQALAEMRAGEKSTHWMWFVLPQFRGLGRSAMAMRYGIASLDEARAYLSHPVLGARLREAVAALAAVEGRTAEQVLGPVDAAKLRSCLTLFEAAGGGAAFAGLLGRWFDGPDPATMAMLQEG